MSFYRQPPPILFYTTFKAIFILVAIQALFTFIVWVGRTWLNSEGLTWVDVTLGSIPSLLALGQMLVWVKTKGRTRTFLIWVFQGCFSVYISGLFLSSAISTWYFLLDSWYLNGFIATLYVGMWVLPWLFPRFAKRILDVQWKISGPALGLSGIAGIIGASIGMFSSRGGRPVEAAIASGVLMTLLAVGWAQFAGYEIWLNRPWAKEEE